MGDLGILRALSGGATAAASGIEGQLIEALNRGDEDRRLQVLLDAEDRGVQREIDREGRAETSASALQDKITRVELAGTGAPQRQIDKFLKKAKGDPDVALSGLRARLLKVETRRTSKDSVLSRISEGVAAGVFSDEVAFGWRNEIDNASPKELKQVIKRVGNQLVSTTGGVARERQEFERERDVGEIERAEAAAARAEAAGGLDVSANFAQERAAQAQLSEVVSKLTGIESLTLSPEETAQLQSQARTLQDQISQFQASRQRTDLPTGVDDGEEKKRLDILQGQSLWKASPTPETEAAIRAILGQQFPGGEGYTPEELDEVILQIKGGIPDVPVNRGGVGGGLNLGLLGNRVPNERQLRNRERAGEFFSGVKDFFTVKDLGQPRDRPTLFPSAAERAGLKGP